MAKLLMITGRGSAVDLASGKRGAFYSTLEEFHKYWDRIDIITPKVKNPVPDIFGNVYIHSSPWPLLFHPVFFIRKSLEIYRQQKFDLITVQEFPPFYNGIAARILWRRIRVPYVLEIFHIPGYPKAGGLKEFFYCWIMRLFVRFDSAKAKAVRVMNQKETPEFLIKAGVPKEKIKYTPALYIDLNIFRVYPEVEKKYDLIFAARLEKNKGMFNLIKAIKIAKQKKPDIKLLIVGQGPELNHIRLQTTNYKLQTNIIFSGWLETSYDVAKAYNSARMFINSSFNEGGPRTAIEAMACGLPVITTRVGVMNDLIRDAENGLFTDWAPVKIAEKVLYLLGDEGLQKKFAETGQELVRQFEKKSAIKNYAEKLKEILG